MVIYLPVWSVVIFVFERREGGTLTFVHVCKMREESRGKRE